MSYELAIRAKHNFEHALEVFLVRASTMSSQELELAVARIADCLSKPDMLLDEKSAMLCSQILIIVLYLRKSCILHENKIQRAWIRTKKKSLVEEVANIKYEQANCIYKEQKSINEEIRREEHNNNQELSRKWTEERQSLSAFRQLFRSDVCPSIKPLTPVPPAPDYNRYRDRVSAWSFDELMIWSLVFYRFPRQLNVENFVDEETVRVTATKLIDRK